jgi:hypothetical protein
MISYNNLYLDKTKQNKNSIQFLIVKGKNKTKKEKKNYIN